MRSMLFVPADSEKKLGKALGVGADALILDLEDSVAAANKAAARPLAASFIRDTKAKPHRPKIYVRINALDTTFWRDDLAGVMASKPDGIILPKPNSAADVATLAKHIDAIEAALTIPLGTTTLIAIASEVPQAVFNFATYLTATPRLEGISWGAEDLSALMGSSATREPDGRWTQPYQLARNLCLYAAVGAGRQPIDTVYVDFKNLAGLAEECRIAARDGFTAKMAIHPDQVATINDAFTPSEKEFAWATEIIALFAANPNAGALSLRGQMIDKPHAVRAERILARAKAAKLS